MATTSSKGLEARQSIIVANISMAKASGQPMYVTYAHLIDQETEDYFIMAVNRESKLILFVPHWESCMIIVQRFQMDFEQNELISHALHFRSEAETFGNLVDDFEDALQEWALGAENRWTF